MFPTLSHLSCHGRLSEQWTHSSGHCLYHLRPCQSNKRMQVAGPASSLNFQVLFLLGCRHSDDMLAGRAWSCSEGRERSNMPGTAKSESPDVRLGPHGLTTSQQTDAGTGLSRVSAAVTPSSPRCVDRTGPEQQPRGLGKCPQRWGAASTPRGVRGAMALTCPEQAGRALCEVASSARGQPWQAFGPGTWRWHLPRGTVFPLHSVHSGGAGWWGWGCSQQPCSTWSPQKTGSVGI